MATFSPPSSSLDCTFSVYTVFMFVSEGKQEILNLFDRDGTAKLWNCGQGKCIATLLTVESVINCCALTSVTDVISLPPPEENPGMISTEYPL